MTTHSNENSKRSTSSSSIPAFNYLNPRNQILKFATNKLAMNLEYQNIQQQCDENLLHELSQKQNENNQNKQKGNNKKSNQEKEKRSENKQEVKNKKAPIRKILQLHKYQNINESDRLDRLKNPKNFLDDTKLIMNRNKRESSIASDKYEKYEYQDGVYRIMSHNDLTLLNETVPPTAMHFDMNIFSKIQKSVDRHLTSTSSSNSNLSSTTSGSNSFNSFDSVEQAIMLQKNPESGSSYLGPFNFRQLLRPTQGPTESLRKRKGINPPSPPPPQRGKSIL